MKLDLTDVDIRVIDQRIGAGIGGLDTVIRVLHKPTGIIIEVPRITSSQFQDRQVALDVLEMALKAVPCRAALAQGGVNDEG